MFWKKKKKYIYVLVRTDLPLADQIVQVGHACFDAGTKYGKLGASLVLLAIRNEHEIHEWIEILNSFRIKHVVFYEPDPIIDGDTVPMGSTAICTKPLHGFVREVFSKCKLWEPPA